MTERHRLLQVVQPSLLGWTDGVLGTLAPLFAAAYLHGTHTALLVGLASAIGAAVSMGVSEAISDPGDITERGGAWRRGGLTGLATLLGGAIHALPFLLHDLQTALILAYAVVAAEIAAIAWARKKYFHVRFSHSMLQVSAGGLSVVAVGALLGHS